jgi:hypothetical protein
MINAQHAHIYRIHTLHFIFGEIFFLKILSIQPLTLCLCELCGSCLHLKLAKLDICSDLITCLHLQLAKQPAPGTERQMICMPSVKCTAYCQES